MSYRAFKRLLGETSLERKCRFLFGGFILLLITGIFWWYARQTEHLAYDQLPTTCKLLVNHIVARQIATACRPRDERDAQVAAALEEFRRTREEPRPLHKYDDFVFITPSTSRRDKRPDSEFAQQRLKEFLNDPDKHLKEVSDASSAGELNVRSEIQTGDEFEDLSHAFNRMLRNLVAMQDRLRKVNGDLDRKVDELAQANLALYETNQLKSDFLATMSHELRTPLNSILGFSDVLLTGDQLNDKQQRWVSNIKTSGERLLALINDILDLAKIEAGKMQVRVGEFNLHDICEGMLTMFRPLAEKKNIDLRGQLEPGIPPLRQDVGKVQQIMANLLSNAVKFTPEGCRVLLKASLGPPSLGRAGLPGRDLLGLSSAEEPAPPADIPL